jgi:hypothetical protein
MFGGTQADAAPAGKGAKAQPPPAKAKAPPAKGAPVDTGNDEAAVKAALEAEQKRLAEL